MQPYWFQKHSNQFPKALNPREVEGVEGIKEGKAVEDEQDKVRGKEVAEVEAVRAVEFEQVEEVKVRNKEVAEIEAGKVLTFRFNDVHSI